MPSFYHSLIRETMARFGRLGAVDPRHVEAWMRLEHGTLDALTRRQLTAAVRSALDCIAASSCSENDALAASFGL